MSIAVYDLGITEDYFWTLTPRKYDGLLKRCDFHKRHRELLTGITTAATVNFSSVYKAMMQDDHPPKMTKPEDFMPSEWAKKTPAKKEKKPKRMTRRQRQEVVQSLRAMFKPAIDAAKRNK